jgi:hypothetical protein
MPKWIYRVGLFVLLQYFFANIAIGDNAPPLPEINQKISNNNSSSSWMDNVMQVFGFGEKEKNLNVTSSGKEAFADQDSRNIGNPSHKNSMINIQNEIANIDQKLSENNNPVNNMNSNIISDKTTQVSNDGNNNPSANLILTPIDGPPTTPTPQANVGTEEMQINIPDNNVANKEISTSQQVKADTQTPISNNLDVTLTTNKPSESQVGGVASPVADIKPDPVNVVDNVATNIPTEPLQLDPQKISINPRQKTNLSHKVASKSNSILDLQPTKAKLEAKESSQDQIDFVNAELIMLQMPDGDFVCGEMTDKAKLYRMSFDQYVKIFWENFETKDQQIAKDQIDQYVANRNQMFLEPISNSKIKQVNDQTKQLALNYLVKGNLNDLRALIENYSLLNIKYENGNNLLHLSSYLNKEIFARYLLTKGINQFAINDRKMTAYNIANLLQNFDIVRLLLNINITKHLYY